MPRATVQLEATEKHDLKTCPEGFVTLRRLSYGEKIQRRAMVSKMRIEATKRGSKDFGGEMQLMDERSTLFDFERCIIDHNLEDESGNKLNLSSATDIKRLDPRIGEEIESLLDALNNFEEEDGEGNF